MTTLEAWEAMPAKHSYRILAQGSQPQTEAPADRGGERRPKPLGRSPRRVAQPRVRPGGSVGTPQRVTGRPTTQALDSPERRRTFGARASPAKLGQGVSDAG